MSNEGELFYATKFELGILKQSGMTRQEYEDGIKRLRKKFHQKKYDKAFKGFRV
jgi:hypothetical protein